MLNQWILARGGVAANEDQQAIRQVRSFIEQHGESRFTPKQIGYSSQVRQRARWLDTTGPQTLYLFYPTDLDEKIKKPCIYKQITGLLRHSWTGKKTIRCFGSVYMYFVYSAVFKCFVFPFAPSEVYM